MRPIGGCRNIEVEANTFINAGARFAVPNMAVTIGRGAVIAAGAAVTRDVARLSAVGGVPGAIDSSYFGH